MCPLSFQEAVLVHLRLDLRSKRLVRGAEIGKERAVGRVGGGGVHGAVGLAPLEMRTDVVVGGVRVRARLRVVVAPQLAPGIEDGTGGRGKGFFNTEAVMRDA